MSKDNLNRFIEAQQTTYETALAEIKSGRKTGHWMWFIFPQIQGLGATETSKYYSITDIGEAMEFLSHRCSASGWSIYAALCCNCRRMTRKRFSEAPITLNCSPR